MGSSCLEITDQPCNSCIWSVFRRENFDYQLHLKLKTHPSHETKGLRHDQNFGTKTLSEGKGPLRRNTQGWIPLTTNGQIPKSSNVSAYSALNPEPRRQIWAFSSFHRVQRKKYINIKYTSSFLVCLIFLYVFGFCCCPAFILWEQLSTSLLTYLGLLTPLLAPGWEYDPKVVIESTDAPGRREGPKPEKWARA